MLWCATVFDETGSSTTKLGSPTPEDALKSLSLFFPPYSMITYRPYDGLIFVEGKPCGVVFRSYLDQSLTLFER
jgi:hypothetical protein